MKSKHYLGSTFCKNIILTQILGLHTIFQGLSFLVTLSLWPCNLTEEEIRSMNDGHGKQTYSTNQAFQQPKLKWDLFQKEQ